MSILAGPRSILVVDDEQMVLEVIRDILEAAGYAITATHDPQKAVDLIWKEDFDVILTDLGMPVVSGWALAKQVKARNTSTPVILFTGWGAQYEEADLSRAGVDLVLTKPLDWKKLIEAVEILAGQSGNNLKDHRKHWRLPGKQGALVQLKSPVSSAPVSRVRIVDISRDGLSFRHGGTPNHPSSLLSLDLILEDGIEIDSVPCKVLYDIEFMEKSGLDQIKAARRCGVHFEKLSENQVSQLESYLRRRAFDDEVGKGF